MKKLCQRCQRQIPKGRLQVLPETNLCLRCSDEIGGDFEISVLEENLGSSVVSKTVIYKTPRYIEPL